MLSVTTKHHLKSALVWGIYLGTAVFSTIGLGIAPIYAGVLALTLLLYPLPLMTKNPAVKIESWQYTSIFLILLAGAASAFLLTSSWAFSAAVFYSPTAIVWFTRLFETNQSKLINLIKTNSEIRPINLATPSEKNFNNLVQKVSAKTGIRVKNIYVMEMLSKINQDNASEKRKDFSMVKRKDLLAIKSDTAFFAKYKEIMNINVAAVSTFSGNDIIVNSTTLDGRGNYTNKELEAIIGHEMGHHQHKDSFRSLFAISLYNITLLFGLGSLRLMGAAVVAVAHVSSVYLGKNKEYSADLYSAKHGYAKDLSAAFKKLEAWREEHKYKGKEEEGLFSKCKSYYNEWSSTHPETKDRIQLLERYQTENQARQTMNKNNPFHKAKFA